MVKVVKKVIRAIFFRREVKLPQIQIQTTKL